MRLNNRVAQLARRLFKEPTIEIVFRDLKESYEDAAKRGREKFPNVDKLIIISWIES
jgi:hypothetical protein